MNMTYVFCVYNPSINQYEAIGHICILCVEEIQLSLKMY